ncbi:MAG: hypothetical protein EP346_07420 [Bacteroidetes bacterium]|nr:MAG: hypothetical protein EP346_07420 [Bacteroidota bacterium]
MRYLSLCLLSISSLLSLGQNDTAMAYILPYFEPFHSDRPGFTYDAKHLRSGIIVQSGASQFTDENNRLLGFNARLRWGTCIGEIDFFTGSSQNSQDFSTSSSTLVYDRFSFASSFNVGMGYRYSLSFGKSFTLGALAQASYSRNTTQHNWTEYRIQPDTAILFNFDYLSKSNRGSASVYLNLNYQISESFGIASSIGYIQPRFEAYLGNFSATLNVHYNYHNFGVFAEGMMSDIGSSSFQIQTGASYLLGNNFALDAFVSSLDGDYDHLVWSAGFTYYMR